jgi:prepilin-type processing-associated H-X9-DG protein
MIELLIVVVGLAILAALGIAALSEAKDKAMNIHCVCRLKNIGLAQRIFATDNEDLFPWERAVASETNRNNFPDLTGLTAGDQVVRIYRTLSNELTTPKIIACSADSRKPAKDWVKVTTNSVSYFVGLSARESLPQAFMAGDRNLLLNGKDLTGRVELKSGAPVEWSKKVHRFQGNVAMGDGSVQQLSSGNRVQNLQEALNNTGVENNVFLIP